MAVFNEPTKWAQTLGQDADVTTIPNTAGDTDPSIDKIFPSVFSIPLANGGRAIPRSVLNGLFKLLGDWVYYIQNGGIASYSNTFDYAVGAFVKYNNEFYRCIQANGASSTVKAPTNTAYWSKITTLADVAGAFANQDLSNLSASGQAILDNKANISFSNVNNIAKIAMAHNSMPSYTFDVLTLGASQTLYTAPSDGYFYLTKHCVNVGEYLAINLRNQSNDGNVMQTVGSASKANEYPAIFLPVSKGQKVRVDYSATGTNTGFMFIYAQGAISEHA